MELNKSDIQTIGEELKEESAWIETDLVRRRNLRASFEKGEVSLFISSLQHEMPRISIKSPTGNSFDHFARAQNLEEGKQLPDPNGHRDLVGVERLSQEQNPAKRLELIAEQLPAFIESFSYTQKVPIKIFLSYEDMHANQPAATILPGTSRELPLVEIDRSRLEPFYTGSEGN